LKGGSGATVDTGAGFAIAEGKKQGAGGGCRIVQAFCQQGMRLGQEIGKRHQKSPLFGVRRPIRWHGNAGEDCRGSGRATSFATSNAITTKGKGPVCTVLNAASK